MKLANSNTSGKILVESQEIENNDSHNKSKINVSTDNLLPFSFAKRHGILVRSCFEGYADTVHKKNTSPLVLSEVRRFTGKKLKLSKISSTDFESTLSNIYEQGGQVSNQIMDDLSQKNDLLQISEELPESSDLLDSDNDAPIIRFINAILTEALKNNASDVHIEPYENNLVIRFRIDGVLKEILQTQKNLSPLVVSRIKVMSKLDIAEKRLPQDGRISIKIAGRSVDIRVSTIPSGHGERVVLRLLDKKAGRLDLSLLGMQKSSLRTVKSLIKKPHGIILVTGPTGSGKTTTLYAALEEINDNSCNIMTVEDPIEYLIDGIGQTQVNTKVSMTFAKGLRAILRQDPDVVMVGEIRDLETAEIAIQASLTGHLVFSTLHTNTAIGAITRLRDMGVEPFLLSSSLIGVIAQRLVRILDEESKELYIPSNYERQVLKIKKNENIQLCRPKHPNDNGYKGRTGIYEVISLDDSIRSMIHSGESEQKLEQYARTISPSINHDARRHVLDGKTTIEEMIRVTKVEE